MKSVLLVSIIVLSMFAFTQVMLVQAEATTEAAGWHTMTAEYYKAYIYDDHDDWPKGAGEWYFRIYEGTYSNVWNSYSPKFSRDGPGWADFSDRIGIWNIKGSTYFQCQAREEDTFGWDYTSTLQVNVGLGGPFNTWRYGNMKVGDVNHYYRFKIDNRNPWVGSISEPSSCYRKVAYTWSTTGGDADGDSVTFYWYVDGVLKKTGTSSFTYTFPTGAALGTHNIQVKTRDYFGFYSSTTTKFITIVNRAPTVGAISGPSSGSPGVPYTYSTTGSDPDGDPITYQWSVNGVVQPSTGPSMTYTFSAAGTYTVRVRTKDNHGAYSIYSSKTVNIITASFQIWTDKASYKIGETMKVYVRVKNPGPALPVRALIYLKLPSGTLYGPLLSMVTILPASWDSGTVLWNSFTIPSAPIGNYAWIAQLRNPATNALISQDTWNWMLWP